MGKGARLPTCDAEFRFKVADMNFHSTSYDWLVCGGPKCHIKGHGTINGAGDYGFLLSASTDSCPEAVAMTS